MNEKEYLKEKDLPNELISIQGDGDEQPNSPYYIESYRLSFLLNDYHKVKSEEEAGERYRKALSYYDKETYMNGKSTVAVVNAIRLASGKEDDG